VGDRHHEILLLQLNAYLASHFPVDEDGSKEDKQQKSAAFANVPGGLPVLFLQDGFGPDLITGVVHGQLPQPVFGHLVIGGLQGDEPPGQPSNDIGQQYPVDGGGDGQPFLFE